MGSRAALAVLVAGLVVAGGASCYPAAPLGSTSSQLTLAAPVLFAEKAMSIGASNNIAGDVVVRQIEPLPSPTTATPPKVTTSPAATPQLIIGEKSRVATDAACRPTAIVVANSILLQNAACTGDVYSNEVDNPSGGTVGSVQPFPATPLDAQPLAFLPPTGAPVTVAASATLALPPGAYGDLSIGDSAIVELASGTYSFGSITLGIGSRLVTTTSGVSVNALGLSANRAAVIDVGSGLKAAELQIYLSASASFGKADRLHALIAAPHGDMTFGDDVRATGAFAAFTIETQSRVRM